MTFVVTTVSLQKTTLPELRTITTLEVVHNETINNPKRNYPKNVSGPTNHNQNTLLQTSIAVFSGIIFYYSFFPLLMLVKKLHEKKNVFQNLTE